MRGSQSIQKSISHDSRMGGSSMGMFISHLEEEITSAKDGLRAVSNLLSNAIYRLLQHTINSILYTVHFFAGVIYYPVCVVYKSIRRNR